MLSIIEILIIAKTVFLPADFTVNYAKTFTSLFHLVDSSQNSCLPIPDQSPLPSPLSSREVQFVQYKALGKVKVESSFIRINGKEEFNSREDSIANERLRIYREGKVLYESKSIPESTYAYGIGFYLHDIDLDGEPEVIVLGDRKTYGSISIRH
ncbi:MULTISPECIES: hypothetical protein [Pseudanabaena]|uniref:Uncharacterized protein n=2 Tax=Pseudanabaena TaxID=1152 RepID=L8MUW1_9CYAN|nr:MULTISPECIES: hypothetical protein [Pseudanabaena]ELS30245.1 hypothetical protein Pse7429DRAFT_4656 [Pseudanabaena biceps PCC 7429]MDG3497469.1 hypothetical protein [Pseudanabaena catenata USMAC16]